MTRSGSAERSSRAPGILDREESEALGRRVLSLLSADQAQVDVTSQVSARTSFARSDAYVAAEDAGAGVTLNVIFSEGRNCIASTTRLDDAGLTALVPEAEAAARQQRPSEFPYDVAGARQYPAAPTRFHDAALREMEPDARAVDLARRSAKPAAVEPGRYTVILEPAAVADLVGAIVAPPRLDAFAADMGWTVFSKEPLGTNKIGLQMMDRRLWLVSDPRDPELPMSIVGDNGELLEKVAWFERGVLTNLRYDPSYAKTKNRAPVFMPDGARLYAEGPTQTLDEMIGSTKRGIWVNRLSNASGSIVAPRVKVRDFDFTSLTDAI